MHGNYPQYRQSQSSNLGDIRLGPLHVDGEAEKGVVQWMREHPFLTTGAVVFAIWWFGKKRG